MILDVSSVVTSFQDQQVTVLRSQGRTFDQATGFFTENAPLEIIKMVHIQPITGRDMDKLRELHDVTEAVRVFSDTSFQIGKGGQVPFRYGVSVYETSDPTNKADQMVWEKKVWEIRPVLDWKPGGYFEAVATL